MTQPTATTTTYSHETDSWRHRSLLVLYLFLLLGCMCAFCLKASAQAGAAGNGKVDVVPLIDAFKQENVVSRMERAAKSFSRFREAPAGFPEGRVAQAFFKDYVPAMITQPDAFEKASKLTQESLEYLSAAQRSNAPSGNFILQWIFQGMQPIAEGNYSDIARINATMALARLDERVADPTSQRPPLPLRRALPILIGLYENEANSEGVRAAALQGMRRHVVYSFPIISPEDRTKLTSLMNDLLAQPTPEDRTEKSHAFLQRYAVDILEYLRTDNGPAVAKKLVSISTDLERDDLIALHSAARMGRMQNEELAGQMPSADKVIESWTVRVWQGVRDEIKFLDSLKGLSPASMQPASPELSITEETKPQVRGRSGGSMGYDDLDRGGSMGYGDMDRAGSMSGSDMSGDYDLGGDYGSSRSGQATSDLDMMYDGMYGGGGRGMGPTTPQYDPQDPEVVATRKRLNYRFEQLFIGASGSPKSGADTGAGGLLSAVPAEQKSVVQNWLTKMEPVLANVNDRKILNSSEFQKMLLAQEIILREMAGDEAKRILKEDLEKQGVKMDRKEREARNSLGSPVAENAETMPTTEDANLPNAGAPNAGAVGGNQPAADGTQPLPAEDVPSLDAIEGFELP